MLPTWLVKAIKSSKYSLAQPIVELIPIHLQFQEATLVTKEQMFRNSLRTQVSSNSQTKIKLFRRSKQLISTTPSSRTSKLPNLLLTVELKARITLSRRADSQTITWGRMKFPSISHRLPRPPESVELVCPRSSKHLKAKAQGSRLEPKQLTRLITLEVQMWESSLVLTRSIDKVESCPHNNHLILGNPVTNEIKKPSLRKLLECKLT